MPTPLLRLWQNCAARTRDRDSEFKPLAKEIEIAWLK
jgi:hypothetical protein